MVVLAAGYAVAAAALTAALIVLGGVLEERTGMNRWVYPSVGLSGTPVLEDSSSDVSLGFLDAEPDLRRRFFSARWRGFWYVPEPVEIELYGAGDDRLDVWLDGALVVRRFPPADMHTEVRTLRLNAGVHELRVEYEQHGGGSNLYLAWAPRGGRPRPIPPHRLFREWPVAEDIRLSRRVEWLEWIVLSVWAVPAVFVIGLLARRLWAARAQLESGPHEGPLWEKGWRIATVLTVAAIAVRAAWARLPGWNPESLWHDDLVYAAIIRADLWSMLTVPIHVAPGLFVIWRGFYELFPDPEWSLQILPFACSIAGIPVMFLVARRLTGDRSMGLLAAAVTALNPLLAHYSVFVHQYPFDFLVTALLLLGAIVLLEDPLRIEPRRFAGMALASSVAPFFSVTSVFTSFPTMHLGALAAMRSRDFNRSRAITVLGCTAAYDLAVFAAYLLLRNRSNERIRGGRFADGFMPLDFLGEAGSWLATNGRQLLEMGHSGTWLPFIGLGCIWLLVRPGTRTPGLLVVGFYATFLLASALEVYPLGSGRSDIFAFPVSIMLLVSGAHLVTAPLPATRAVRLAVATLVVTAALASPPRADYEARNDDRLVEVLMAEERPDDGVVLTWSGGFLTAFYGHWPFDVTAYDRAPNGTQAVIGRAHTLHLDRRRRDSAAVRPGEDTQRQLVRRFLQEFSGRRVWFMAFRAPGEWLPDVLDAFDRGGYAVDEAYRTSEGRLFVAVRRNATSP